MKKNSLLKFVGFLSTTLLIASCDNSSELSDIFSSISEAASSLNSESEIISSIDASSTTEESSKPDITIYTIEESSSSDSSSVESSTSSESISESKSISSLEESSTITSIETDNKWKLDFSKYGESFRSDLAKIMKGYKTSTATYSECLSIGARAAAYPNKNSSTFVPFYHSTSTTTSINSCNREHTWPESRGGGSIETDPFMVRPTITKDNSSRGNNFYGNEKSNEWDPASCGFEAARGESARVILYCAALYKDKGLSLSNNPGDSKTLKTMGTLKTLLKWNSQYPVTYIEKQVNEYLYAQGFGRNPFVDHPEYASFIWDNSGVRTTPYLGGDNYTSSTSYSESSYEEESSSSISSSSYVSRSLQENGEVKLTSSNLKLENGGYYSGSATVADVDISYTNVYVTNKKLQIRYDKDKKSNFTSTSPTGGPIDSITLVANTDTRTSSGVFMTIKIADNPQFSSAETIDVEWISNQLTYTVTPTSTNGLYFYIGCSSNSTGIQLYDSITVNY